MKKSSERAMEAASRLQGGTKIVVNVTKENIKNAVRANSHHCMIADAIAREIPSAKFITVDVQSIRYSDTKTGRRHVLLTPPTAQRALVLFDKGQKMAPFVFTAQQGYSLTMRGRRKDTTKKARAKKYAPKRKAHGAQPHHYMPKPEREFGLRAFTK